MRILLDECVPRPLRRELPGNTVVTVPEMGWSGKKNGELLRLMAAGNLPLLVTTDQELRHQQNLKSFGVAVIVLVAPSNRLEDIAPLSPSLRAILGTVQPGDYVEIKL